MGLSHVNSNGESKRRSIFKEHKEELIQSRFKSQSIRGKASSAMRIEMFYKLK